MNRSERGLFITADHRVPEEYHPVDRRTVIICALAIAIAIGAGLMSRILVALIGLITNLAYFHRFSLSFSSPSDANIGWFAILIPVAGAVVVGLMARFGSPAIRGHGIPEVMEKVLYGESRIPARVMVLKPISAAVAIGTGGPFGAEGPIIATGGAIGSLVGQFVPASSDERKILLAAGAAAGMSATFGTPVSAVLLAIELLLFEYRPRSLIPVALASATAAAVRIAFEGTAAVFAVQPFSQPDGEALAIYTILGVLIGLMAAGITRFTYAIEDGFERLPVHWMWWPAIGAVVVGLAGYMEPRILGVGYIHIEQILAGDITGRALLVLVVLKLLAWAFYLGSGTSGGTLAPLFTIGGGMGAMLGAGVAAFFPSSGVDARVSALVGMAAIFAGASHALLASVVFAFETTRQPVTLLPLLAGCTAGYLASLMWNRNSIMTEKLARRGTEVRTEYQTDYLAHVSVGLAMSRDVVSLRASEDACEVLQMLNRNHLVPHQGFPVLDDNGLLIGVVTRRDLMAHHEHGTVGDLIHRPPAVVYSDNTMRDAADVMVREGVGRLPVVEHAAPRKVIGIVTRSDLLAAHAPRLAANRRASQ